MVFMHSTHNSKGSNFPLSVTVVHNPIRIGVIHGHQCIPYGDIDSLGSIARQMDVDVLISGHTHVYVHWPLVYVHVLSYIPQFPSHRA